MALDECRWPELPARYDRALREAVAYILQRFQPVGILACGTIIRGRPDATSDLDLYVIHRAAFRQRLQRFFAGVPAEIFVNPPQAIERYLVEERAANRPLTAHMLATGFVVLERDPAVAELIGRARAALADPPPPDPAQLTMMRYMAATLLEDATDVAERDPEAAAMLLARAVDEMLRILFRRAGRYEPRAKELLDRLVALDPEAGDLARRFFAAAGPQERLAPAEALADRIIGARGFFEWETSPESTAGDPE